MLDSDSASSMKQESTCRHVAAPFGHITWLLVNQSFILLLNVTCLHQTKIYNTWFESNVTRTPRSVVLDTRTIPIAPLMRFILWRNLLNLKQVYNEWIEHSQLKCIELLNMFSERLAISDGIYIYIIPKKSLMILEG